MKSASSVPPNPNPSKASYARSPYVMKMIVPPRRPRPSVSIPVIVPVRYPSMSALPNPTGAAAATRKLPVVASRIPTNPTVAEKTAPIANAHARPNANGLSHFGLPPPPSWIALVTYSRPIRITMSTATVLSCRFRYAFAPSRTAAAISCMRLVPVSAL